MTQNIEILLVEDDPDIASGLTRGLAAENYSVRYTSQVDEALEHIKDPIIQAAIVDVMIGEDNGLDLVRAARKEGIKKPIIMLSALADVEDRMRGIEAGADDYVVKPFAFGELFARLQVQLIREPAKNTEITLDPGQSTLTFMDQSIQLTAREYQLLDRLAASRGEPVSRWEIFDEMWSGDGSVSENIVDVYIGYLRKKLGQLSADPAPEIRTIRNKGFVLKV